jgi:Tetratricopeptide repeat
LGVQTCSSDGGNPIRKSNRAGWFGRFAEDSSGSPQKQIGAFYYGQGRLTEAKSLLVKALTLWEQILGAEHPHTIGTRNGLAIVRWAMQGRLPPRRFLLLGATLVAVSAVVATALAGLRKRRTEQARLLGLQEFNNFSDRFSQFISLQLTSRREDNLTIGSK